MSDIAKYPTAKLAYEKGFIIRGLHSVKRHYYNRYGELDGDVLYMIQAISNGEDVTGFIYDAPTQSTLQKWLREVHNIFVNVDIDPDIYNSKVNYYALVKNCDPNSKSLGLILLDGFSIYQSYEDALEEGLFEALKLVK